MLYACTSCFYESNKPSGLARHLKTLKHLQKEKEKEKENSKRCSVCSKLYSTASGLWKHQQREHRSEPDPMPDKEDLKSLLLDQRKQHDELLQQLKLQQTQLAELASVPRTTNTTNNVLVFLNTDCCNAVNWSDFVAGLTVELDGDVTESIVKTVCDGIKQLGVHRRRPIHCVDVKRRKLYLKTDNVWENDAVKIRTALRESHTLLQNQCRAKLQAWDQTHPEWFHHDDEIERYRKLAVQIHEEVDEEKCTLAISRTVGL